MNREQLVLDNQQLTQLLEAKQALYRLSDLSKLIRHHGISSPMMKAGDPYNELVNAGLCNSYEELDNNIIRDDGSYELANRIDVLIESKFEEINTSIEGFFDKVKKLVESKEDLDKKYRSLVEAYDKFKTIKSFDENKFNDSPKRIRWTKSEMDKIIRGYTKIHPVIDNTTLTKAFSDIMVGVIKLDKNIDKIREDCAKRVGSILGKLNDIPEVREICGVIIILDKGEFKKLQYVSRDTFIANGNKEITNKQAGWAISDIDKYAKEIKHLDEIKLKARNQIITFARAHVNVEKFAHNKLLGNGDVNNISDLHVAFDYSLVVYNAIMNLHRMDGAFDIMFAMDNELRKLIIDAVHCRN